MVPYRYPLQLASKKQARDDNEQSSQSTHSEDDPLDNNEDFDLDNSASALGLDNM